MSVEVRRVQCLSLSKEDEGGYLRKAMVGDKVRIFFNSGLYYVGFLTKIGNKSVDVCLTGANKNISIPLSDIRTFVVMGRGEKCCNYFKI